MIYPGSQGGGFLSSSKSETSGGKTYSHFGLRAVPCQGRIDHYSRAVQELASPGCRNCRDPPTAGCVDSILHGCCKFLHLDSVAFEGQTKGSSSPRIPHPSD